MRLLCVYEFCARFAPETRVGFQRVGQTAGREGKLWLFNKFDAQHSFKQNRNTNKYASRALVMLLVMEHNLRLAQNGAVQTHAIFVNHAVKINFKPIIFVLLQKINPGDEDETSPSDFTSTWSRHRTSKSRALKSAYSSQRTREETPHMCVFIKYWGRAAAACSQRKQYISRIRNRNGPISTWPARQKTGYQAPHAIWASSSSATIVKSKHCDPSTHLSTSLLNPYFPDE